MLDYTSRPLSEKTVTLPLAFPWKCSIIKAPGCTLYLLHIHLQTELRLPLLLSTGGLGLNYIWAEAAIQSETQLYIGRLVQNIREVLRRGISLCNMPGASRVLGKHWHRTVRLPRRGIKTSLPLWILALISSWRPTLACVGHCWVEGNRQTFCVRSR